MRGGGVNVLFRGLADVRVEFAFLGVTVTI